MNIFGAARQEVEAKGGKLPSKTALLGLFAIVCIIVALVVYSRSMATAHPAQTGPGISFSIPTPAAGPAQVPNVAPGRAPAAGAADWTTSAANGASQASAGVGQVLVAWFLTVDFVLALLGLFGLLLGGFFHLLHWSRFFGRAVLLSVGIAEVVFLGAPIVLLLVLDGLAWGGGMLLSSTSSAPR